MKLSTKTSHKTTTKNCRFNLFSNVLFHNLRKKCIFFFGSFQIALFNFSIEKNSKKIYKCNHSSVMCTYKILGEIFFYTSFSRIFRCIYSYEVMFVLHSIYIYMLLYFTSHCSVLSFLWIMVFKIENNIECLYTMY